MKFPGYQVEQADDRSVTIRRVELDETELTPESNWMEGYANADPEEGQWLGRELDAALNVVRRMLG